MPVKASSAVAGITAWAMQGIAATDNNRTLKRTIVLSRFARAR
jgi:hypothetical protein